MRRLYTHTKRDERHKKYQLAEVSPTNDTKLMRCRATKAKTKTKKAKKPISLGRV